MSRYAAAGLMKRWVGVALAGIRARRSGGWARARSDQYTLSARAVLVNTKPFRKWAIRRSAISISSGTRLPSEAAWKTITR